MLAISGVSHAHAKAISQEKMKVVEALYQSNQRATSCRFETMKLNANWPYLVPCIVLWGVMCGFIGGVITAQTLTAVQRGLPLSGGWSWKSVIGLDLACLALFLWFLWKIYCDVNTLITDEYISQPRLFGTLTIAWSQARKITTYGYGITVHGQRGKIVLAPYAYTNPNAVAAKIHQLAERHSIRVT